MSFMLADTPLPDDFVFPEGFGFHATNMRDMFNGTTLPSRMTSFPEGFGSRAALMDSMFARAVFPPRLNFPKGFAARATDMSFMFYKATLPSALTVLPEGFGSQARDISAMFYNAVLHADIDWTQTTFDDLDALAAQGIFGGTVWNGHAIKVVSTAIQAKFAATILP